MSFFDKNEIRHSVDAETVYFFTVAENGKTLLRSLGRRELTDAAVKALVATARAELGAKELTWKVLGVGTAVEKAAGCLKRAGESVEKQVERPEPFELLYHPAEGRLRISKGDEAEAAKVTPLRPEAGPGRKLKVLVVDDSASIRNLLKKMIEEEPDLAVVATAERPSEVEELIRRHRPDVMTLDIHMPEEDGVSLLKRLFPLYRVPTIMVTAISLQEGRKVFEALESGAVDYVQKPDFKEIRNLGVTLREKIRMASQAKVQGASAGASVAPAAPAAGAPMDPRSLIVIGSSTGGTEALKVLLTGLPAQIPPILIVQHIPPVFSKAFADRMNQLCPFEVVEGSESGLAVQPGRVIVAAGGTQMGVKKMGSDLRITVDPAAEPMNRHKPSVDFLFHSIKDQFKGPRAGVILTGMGADGAKGMVALKESGWQTIAQDEATCVVFGMPKEAIRLGGVHETLPLGRIATRLARLLAARAA